MLKSTKVQKFGGNVLWSVWTFGIGFDFKERAGFIGFGPFSIYYDSKGL